MTDAAYTAVPNPAALVYVQPRSAVAANIDGIWLQCYSGTVPHWQVCLGFNPTAEHVWEMWVEHTAMDHPGLLP